MFERILVATGGSPWSDNAVVTAIRLAANRQRELIIAHILEDDPQHQAQGLELSDPQMREQIEETGKHILAGAIERAQETQVAHRTLLPWGGFRRRSCASPRLNRATSSSWVHAILLETNV